MNEDTQLSTLSLGLLSLPLADVPRAIARGETNGNAVEAGLVLMSWLDLVSTGTGRATAYNTKQEQQAAEDAIHERAFAVDRRIYAAMASMPGALDRAKAQVLLRLLSTPIGQAVQTVVNPDEWRAISKLVSQLPPQRMFKLFDQLRKDRVNNARTRKVILSAILDSTKLHWWAVKYRAKLKNALRHALGNREFGVICSSAAIWLDKVAAPDEHTFDPRERAFIDLMCKLAPASPDVPSANEEGWKTERIAEALCFISGRDPGRWQWTSNLFRAFHLAKLDLDKGASLPTEVLEGIRSQHHPDVPKEKILELTSRTDSKGRSKGGMTQRQRGQVQKRAKAAGITVDFDPMKLGQVQLWIHAFEVGMDTRIAMALQRKARSAAELLGMSYDKVHVIVDCSNSMAGSEEQKLRPMATALAMRDPLLATATKSASVTYCGGVMDQATVGMPDAIDIEMGRPRGDSSLAMPLVRALGDEPDVVFIISDGYENAPAGRVAEVMGQVREMGIDTPVFQFCPVMAGEKSSVRELAPGHTTTMPVSDPAALGLSLVRGLLESDPAQGLALLTQKAVAMLEG